MCKGEKNCYSDGLQSVDGYLFCTGCYPWKVDSDTQKFGDGYCDGPNHKQCNDSICKKLKHLYFYHCLFTISLATFNSDGEYGIFVEKLKEFNSDRVEK